MTTSWQTPGLSERLIELHSLSGAEELSAGEIAAKLNAEFSLNLTRNGIIGRCHRLELPPRQSPIVRKYNKKPVRRKPVQVTIAIDDVSSVPMLMVVKPPKPRAPRKPVPLTIYRLKRCHCRWPDGDISASPPFTYCGKRAVGSSSWCEEHYNRAHVAPRKVWA